ncbi:MAG: long-chain fatty acid--CoA ligase [Marinoscillum sp.]
MSASAINKLRTFDLLFHQLKRFPIEDTFAYKVNDVWVKFGTKKSIQLINQLSLGLLELGLEKGDKVALISENRPEWNFIDFACQQIGVVVVPMYPMISSEDYRYIFKHAEIKYAFVSTAQIMEKVKSAIPGLEVEGLYSINNIADSKNWREILELGRDQKADELANLRSQIKPDDLMSIIYTSGTTDKPKGVMLSHKNVVSNVLACSKYSYVESGKDRALSFLPLNHVYERTGVYVYIYLGVAVYYAESMDTIGDNLKDIKPHTFNTVPRLLEKVFDKIMKKGNELGGLKKGVFNRAVALALKFDPNEKQSSVYASQLEIADRLVFSKWREALGGNIKQVQCGAAALQPRLTRVFWAAGIQLLEGYGLTETSPVVCANTPSKLKIGTVGAPIDHTQTRIADGGEVEVKGPGVMLGYYKNEELTAEVMTEDGWFKTGDVGIIDNGFLKITDRKKELFKTSGGLYIAPQQIENKLRESRFIEQAIVVGEGKKFPAALIVPNFEALMEEMSKKFMYITDQNKLIKEPKVIRLFEKEVSKVNDELGKWAGVKAHRIVGVSWTPDSGELTPTLKLKRRVIHEKYEHLIADIYYGDGSVSFAEAEALKTTELELQEQ